MLEVDLHNLGGVAAIRQSWRFKSNASERRTLPPVIKPFTTLSRALAQIVAS